MTDTRPIGVAAGEQELKPNATFGRRLATAFSAVAAFTVLLAAIMISAVWSYQFDQYLRGNLTAYANGVAELVEQAYPVYGGWSIQTLSVIPNFGPMRGIGVQILDHDGALIYDDTTEYHANVGSEAGTSAIVFNPDSPAVAVPIIVNDTRVGSVRVWAYGSGAVLTERDAKFRSGSLTALTIAALVAVALASIAGVLFARRLVRPINAMTTTVKALREGDRSARTGFTGEDEIAVLGQAFDEMADAVEADREMERRLTADVAHELRTPLMGIQATVEAMQDGVMPADGEHLGIVRDETVRLGRLAEAILELTKLERGSLPFEMRPLSLADPAQAAADSLQALVESCELTLEVDLDHSVQVVGDADRLQQAVSNLLSNAARYTPAGGSIRLHVGVHAGTALVEVSDTGIGIAPENVEQVFGRFWRADEARASSTGGLGIGLAVTKEIVERHHGWITVESEPDVGTTFRIHLKQA